MINYLRTKFLKRNNIIYGLKCNIVLSTAGMTYPVRLTVNDGRHHICRQRQIITVDCLHISDAAADQHGVQAESVGAMNVRC